MSFIIANLKTFIQTLQSCIYIHIYIYYIYYIYIYYILYMYNIYIHIIYIVPLGI